uniref:Chromatin licensing and DNA replication factor 1 n=1 Tax=Paramormyrops kingsleyae TaxID=1676925 RepID=A0A3B3S509_9TELE|nr:DNA replication factor Cdt1 [Paramormyrops kingsleyae]
MSQARVTDFFAQSKRSGIARHLTGKSEQKAFVETEVRRTAIKEENTRSTRTKNAAANRPATTRSTRSKKAVQHNPKAAAGLQVDKEETSDAPLERSLEQSQKECPRTPKRTSSEFNLSSELFPPGDSSAKKRARVDLGREVSPTVSKTAEVKTQKKSARKKLILSKEQVTKPVNNHSSLSGENEVKNSNQGASSSPVGKQKTFSKEDVAALKSRLQKIQEQKQKPSPVPAASVDASDVKATLARARELVARVQQRKEKEKTEEAKVVTEETPPEPEDREKVPAYQRYHTLAQDVPPGLSLPYKYKVLAEMFRSTDVIVGMLFNRSETVTFAKVKQGVQDMMHKRFEENHVGQIKTVYPSAYTFRQEKNIPNFSATAKKSSYQLTLEPVLQDEKSGTRPQLSASRLLERRRTFHRNLVGIVKQHHRAFLTSLDPPLSVPDDKLTRWHPRFNVDEVPNIQLSELPQPPHLDKLTTAQEVLDKARSLMTPKMEKALSNLALKTEVPLTKDSEPPEKTQSAPGTPRALAGISQSLVERIRAKEAQKLQAAMMRSPQQEERMLMMSRLAELARILRNVFVAEKKPALVMEVACNHMTSSYRSALSVGEMEKHLRLLAELAPEWLTVHQIRKESYLKLNKTVDLNVILQKLNKKMQEEEKC